MTCFLFSLFFAFSGLIFGVIWLAEIRLEAVTFCENKPVFSFGIIMPIILLFVTKPYFHPKRALVSVANPRKISSILA